MHVLRRTTKKPPDYAGGFVVGAQRPRLHQALGRFMVVVLHTIFVASHLAIQLVDQLVHGSIQIRMGALGEHVIAFDVDVALGALSSLLFLLLLDCQKNFDIHQLVKMPGYSV
jgi:hypothetical protein